MLVKLTTYRPPSLWPGCPSINEESRSRETDVALALFTRTVCKMDWPREILAGVNFNKPFFGSKKLDSFK